MAQRSLASCGCIVLLVGLALAGLGALAFFTFLPGEGFAGKLDSFLESMQPIELRLVAAEQLEDDSWRLSVEVDPHDDWQLTSLELSAQLKLVTPGSEALRPTELLSGPPRTLDSAPFVAIFLAEPWVAELDDLELLVRVDVSAEKHLGSTTTNQAYTANLPLGQRLVAAPEVVTPAAPDAPDVATPDPDDEPR